MPYIYISFLLYFFVIPCIPLPAATEPLTDTPLAQDSGLHWDQLLADAASEIGLPSLAEGLYKKILTYLDPNEESYTSTALKLSNVLLQEAKYEEARQILETKTYKPNSSWYLRHAWTGLADKRWNSIQQDLSYIQKEDLSPCEKAWYYLLKGLYKQAHHNKIKLKTTLIKR